MSSIEAVLALGIWLGSVLCLWLYFYKREKTLLNRLQHMIDRAAKGELERSEISETKFSALEDSLKHCLDNGLCEGNIQRNEKNVIQGLISDISHQTLTPVSNIKIYTELLEEEMDGKSEELQTIKEQAEKMDFLIQSLVRLSRMESGIIAARVKKTEVAQLLETVEKEYRAKAEEKQITLLAENTKAQACFDLKWTGEALGNIVDNAIKYTGFGGDVRISSEVYSFFIKIDVSDNGIGIEKEEQNQIFSRFYRSIEVSEEPGVGIGLYLAREIIQAQKGYITVTSEKGHGSVFSVFLPL